MAWQSLHRRSEAPYPGAPEEPWGRQRSPRERLSLNPVTEHGRLTLGAAALRRHVLISPS